MKGGGEARSWSRGWVGGDEDRCAAIGVSPSFAEQRCLLNDFFFCRTTLLRDYFSAKQFFFPPYFSCNGFLFCMK